MIKATLAAVVGLASIQFAVAQPTAKVQVLHNAADPAAASVDIYLGTQKILDDFAFRTASPFVDVPAGVEVTIAVAPGTSTSASEALATFPFTLAANGRYIAVANGVLTPASFAANPDGTMIGFDVYPVADVRETAQTTGNVDILVWHGASDVSAVDIFAGGEPVIENLGYARASSYISVPPGQYPIGVALTGGNPILTYRADVSGLADKVITVVASGFLDPAQNANGPAFGLFAVTADGGPFQPLELLPTTPQARVQIVHNAADPATAVVDVYVDGTLAVDDFAFRTATPYLNLEPNRDYSVAVAPGTSTSVADAIATFPVNVPAGRYVVFANGVIGEGFSPNFNDKPIAFNIYPIGGIRPIAQSESNIDFVVFHGATDAGGVDVRVGNDNLVTNLKYGEHSDYISVPASNYVVGVAPTTGDVIASYRIDATNLAGQSAVIFASGFLAPQANNNGPAFGLFALLGEAVVALPAVTSSVAGFEPIPNAGIAPNPSATSATTSFTLPTDARVTLRVTDMTGSTVSMRDLGMLSAGEHRIALDVNAVAAGRYTLTIDAGTNRSALPLSIVR